VLAEHDGEPVMARQDRVLVATFHPELTDSTKVHQYFCDMVEQSKAAA
jgi:5'-phosphate synthase pdxT subunit